MDLQLQNDVAVVFGAASGIGHAIAKAFAAEGAKTVIVDRDERVHDVAATFQATAYVADVTDYSRTQRLAEQIAAEVGPVRHVVFAVGAGSGKFGFPFWNLTPVDWPRIIEINLLGAVHVAHAFAPQLATQRKGTMLFISSVAGQIGSQTDPPYSAAKAGLINFAQVAAKDLAPHNVRVNVVSPGMIQTPLNRSVWQAWHDQQLPEQRQTYEEWGLEKVRRIAPLGRWQTPEDVAAMAVFLASDRAGNITGQTINVDGGQVMHS
jgi:NAD(P)-dependent dehydrogenase (short-subunit alcohol dehydrogenase family)